ncbi:MAG: MiaB/RimO family radical SAM methylthiotransferase [Elusimicrobia bacterium]|nr:MiaB/RimO family radical SAM methylthiotransferase [Elusimicrobiota bacterium]
MRVYFKSFGCRVNQFETQSMRERLLADPSCREESHWRGADVVVVNTCTVTSQADQEALRLIRRISRDNPAARLVVTGCLASRDPSAILKEAPAASVVGNDGKEGLPAMLGCRAAPSELRGFQGHSRAFVKIQDGCNMDCRYCIIPAVRPRLSCLSYPELESQARTLIEQGYPELVLCGIRLGRYLSEDGAGRRVDLPVALERLAALKGSFRLRLSSLEITDLTDRLLELVAGSGGRICPSFHLPLQSGSDQVLKAMNRWYSAAFYRRRIESLRRHLPEAGLYTDVMVGYPAETRKRFEEGLRFVEEIGFSGLHVFRYSPRPGTPASASRGLPDREIQSRAGAMRSIDSRLRERFAAKAVGRMRIVVPELDGRHALSEDFLTLALERPLPRGLHVLRVSRAQDGSLIASPSVL